MVVSVSVSVSASEQQYMLRQQKRECHSFIYEQTMNYSCHANLASFFFAVTHTKTTPGFFPHLPNFKLARS